MGLLLLHMPTGVIWEVYEWPTIYFHVSFGLIFVPFCFFTGWNCLENLFALSRAGSSQSCSRSKWSFSEISRWERTQLTKRSHRIFGSSKFRRIFLTRLLFYRTVHRWCFLVCQILGSIFPFFGFHNTCPLSTPHFFEAIVTKLKKCRKKGKR